MGIEIERKFLVRDERWRSIAARSRRIRQGYLERGAELSIRVRIIDDQEAALTIKSAVSGVRRLEFEYPLPLQDAEQLLALCQGTLVKTRHEVPVSDQTWEVDVFEGDNAGLVIAEIEIGHEEQPLQLPSWLGDEITGDPRYYNSHLTEHPLQKTSE